MRTKDNKKKIHKNRESAREDPQDIYPENILYYN